MRGVLPTNYKAPQPDAEQRKRQQQNRIAGWAAGIPEQLLMPRAAPRRMKTPVARSETGHSQQRPATASRDRPQPAETGHSQLFSGQGQDRARGGQPLVEMGAVGGEDDLAVAETPEEGERGVEDEGPDEQHAGHGQTGIVLRRDDREDRKGVAQERAADVAHPTGRLRTEDAGRRPVVTQEAQAGRGQQ